MLTSSSTTMGGYVLGVANALDQQGLDSQTILCKAGIERRPRNDPTDRVVAENISQLFSACVKITKDEYFGIEASRYLNVSNFHSVGYSLAASETLHELCHRVERHIKLISQASSVRVKTIGNTVSMIFRVGDEVCHESQDTAVTFLIRLMRSVYKRDFRPLHVDLIRPLPSSGDKPFLDFFQSSVAFDKTRIAIHFNRADMVKPLIGASQELAQHNDSLAIKYSALVDCSDISQKVTSEILELLPSGRISKKLIAENLHMSINNLHNKLARQKTSYTELYDEVRKGIACDHLTQNHTSISEVSYYLGFADTSNFTRAFRRWMGISPTEYRLSRLGG